MKLVKEMYKYDDILMGYEVAALRFLTEDCGLNKEEALKFLKRYWQRKEYEKLALSMETDVTVVEELRNNIIGKTRPWEAAKGTIRELYGNKNPEHDPIENIIHCSGSLEEARSEVALWFPELA